MNLKQLFLGLLATASINTLQAQDVLYKLNGGMEEVKVKEVGPKTITYKRWNNLSGPDFVINKNEVDRIQYENGDDEEYGRRERMTPDRMHRERRKPVEREHGSRERSASNANYGRNILSLAPIFMTNTSATGVGLSFESIVDRNGIFSIYLPAAFSFRNNQYYDNYYNNNQRTDDHMFWFYPGVKIYPTGAFGKVRYAIGASIALGSGSETYQQGVYDPTFGGTVYKTFENSTFVMGAMLNNSLNIQPTPHLHLGLELGLGIPYYTDYDNNNNNYYSSGYGMYDGEPLVQFNFKIGYRF
jgi:hypothetical protein